MLYRILISLITGLLLFINVRLYYAPSKENTLRQVEHQLNYLDHALDNGADDAMQALFPEGFFFMHALYGLTWTELARSLPDDEHLQRRARAAARHALTQLNSSEGRRVFDVDLEPPYGVFHTGWRLLLHGSLIAITDSSADDSTDSSLFIANCDRLARAFETSETPFLPSYSNAAWPADALVGVAALHLHDVLFEPRYTRTIADWIVRAKRYLDPETGLLPHHVHAQTGSILEGARGSSQVFMLRLLHEIDPAFAVAQYKRFRRYFVDTWAGLPGIREYPIGHKGRGDLDSGPIFGELGSAATIVGLGTARIYQDTTLSMTLRQTIEAFGLPVTWGSKKRYIFGQLPIGDAFLAWSAIVRPVEPLGQQHLAVYNISNLWRLPVHGISLFIITILWIPVLRNKLRKAKKSDQARHPQP